MPGRGKDDGPGEAAPLTVDTACLIPLPVDATEDYDGAAGQRWFCVLFAPRIAVRNLPDVRACPVATANVGEVIEVAAIRNGWARLTDIEAARRGVFQCEEAWALIDGQAFGKGLLLQPCLPRFFRVIFAPSIPILDTPGRRADRWNHEAVVVAVAQVGEVLEVAETRNGWVRLTEAEAHARGVPEDCQAWALFNSVAVGLEQLLEARFVPLLPEEAEEKENIAGNRPGAGALKAFGDLREGLQGWFHKTRFGNMIPDQLELAQSPESEALAVHTHQEPDLPLVSFSSIFKYEDSVVCFFERQYPRDGQDLLPLQMVGEGYQVLTSGEGFRRAHWATTEGRYARLAKSWTSLADLLVQPRAEGPKALLDDDAWEDFDPEDPPDLPRAGHAEPAWGHPADQPPAAAAASGSDGADLFDCIEII